MRPSAQLIIKTFPNGTAPKTDKFLWIPVSPRLGIHFTTPPPPHHHHHTQHTATPTTVCYSSSHMSAPNLSPGASAAVGRKTLGPSISQPSLLFLPTYLEVIEDHPAALPPWPPYSWVHPGAPIARYRCQASSIPCFQGHFQGLFFYSQGPTTIN